MNINNVTENIEVPDTFEGIWKSIFAKQTELLEKYKEIEKMPDNILELDNINTQRGQILIKDFAWRVTEELAEAWEAKEINEEHFKEELADALHFLVELTIIAGYNSTFLVNPEGALIADKDTEAWAIVYNLGLMCNTLKNKPWKQSQMLTDEPKFKEYLQKAWLALLKLLYWYMGSYNQIYLYYFKKHKVNEFRVRSKY